MVKIRAKKCKLCNHITGLLNEQCEECDSTDLIVIEYEPEPGEDPTWVVSVRRLCEGTDDAFQWLNTLQANANEFEGNLAGHEMEVIEVSEEGQKKRSAGAVTIFWVFSPVDALRVIELVKKLTTFRPGLLENAQIEVDYQDVVEV